ncbi:MAG: hypothetical protein ABJC13_01685 [Acidobacteriota bacterium]
MAASLFNQALRDRPPVDRIEGQLFEKGSPMSIPSSKSHVVLLSALVLSVLFLIGLAIAPEPAYAACTDGDQRWVTTGTCCYLGSGVYQKLKLQWCDRGVWTSTSTFKCSGGCIS